MRTMLSIEGVGVRFGPIPALRDATLDVRTGEVVVVVGPNGAGKTTLLRAIAGLEPIAAGRIRLGEQDLTRLRPHRRVEAGLALVPQGRRVFPESTVERNLWAGAFARSDRDAVADDLERILGLFDSLARHRHSLAGVLSGGEQQMLAVARAMLSRPQVLLLDEPSMGLAPIMVGRIYELLTELAAQGTTMLLVEQNVARALQIGQRVFVLRSGEFVARGLDADGLTADELVAGYLSEATPLREEVS
jgi:branched-chain amino acid transport system ATP-binding protein